MKRVILFPTLLLSLFLTSCATLPDMEETFFNYGYDFRKYAAQGFLITPGDYKGEYMVMGLLECSATPQAYKQNYDQNAIRFQPPDGTRIYFRMMGNNMFKIKEISTDSLIGFMHRTAINMGADAIINFTISTEILPRYDLKVPKVTGIAIKRKN